MFLLLYYQNQKFFHSCCTRVVRVALVSHLCRTRIVCISLMLLLYCLCRISVARVAFVSLVSGTRVVN